MTEQEAIDYFNNATIDTRIGLENMTKTTEIINISINALEKQIPKKPKIVEVDRDGMDIETGEEYTYKIDEAYCSRCDSLIGSEYDCFDDCHCSKCGQKIDWSCW